MGFFKTQWVDHQKKIHDCWLRSSPELHLKQALSMGLDKVYQIGQAFRNNGEISEWHHPEFTMLEWYQAELGYHEMMAQTEELLRYSWKDINNAHPIQWKMPHKFKKITVTEAFQKYANIELIDNDPQLWKKAIDNDVISVNQKEDFETAFYKVLLEKIEPALKQEQVIFLYDYPASQAALAETIGPIAQRFELYFHGIELCNAFYELTSPEENQDRFSRAQETRATLGYPQVPEDEAFISALKKGIPKSSGNALGFDRWLAILLNQSNISNVIPFYKRDPFQQ